MQSDWIVSENPLREELWDKTLLQPLVLMNTDQKVRLLKLKNKPYNRQSYNWWRISLWWLIRVKARTLLTVCASNQC